MIITYFKVEENLVEKQKKEYFLLSNLILFLGFYRFYG